MGCCIGTCLIVAGICVMCFIGKVVRLFWADNESHLRKLQLTTAASVRVSYFTTAVVFVTSPELGTIRKINEIPELKIGISDWWTLTL